MSYKKDELIKKQISNWNEFLQKDKIKGISSKNKLIYDKILLEAKKQLSLDNSSYFLGKLKQKDNYLLYDYFRDSVIFLDVEADYRKQIYLIGIYDGFDIKFLVKNKNLYRDILKQILNSFKLIVTFNGSSYDLPLIEKQFKININIPHIDLKHFCNKNDLTGTLKEIETKLKIKRPKHLKGSPVDLWKTMHASCDEEYFKLLLNYNEEDVINLKFILEKIMKKV